MSPFHQKEPFAAAHSRPLWKTTSAVLKIAQGKQSITENTTAYGLSFIIIPLCRAECFSIGPALRCALLTVNHLTPARKTWRSPGGSNHSKSCCLTDVTVYIWAFLWDGSFFQATVSWPWQPGFVNDIFFKGLREKKIRLRQQELCFFSRCVFSLTYFPFIFSPDFLFYFLIVFSRTISPSPSRPLYFREVPHNGISHCTWEYLPTQHRWKDLPPLLSYASSLLPPPLCFPLLVWIYLTVLFQLSLQQQMSAILELNWELSLLNWAQGYLTCLTRCLTAEFFQVSQSSFCSWSKRGSSTVVFTDIFHII